jgi:hypothetical protein
MLCLFPLVRQAPLPLTKFTDIEPKFLSAWADGPLAKRPSCEIPRLIHDRANQHSPDWRPRGFGLRGSPCDVFVYDIPLMGGIQCCANHLLGREYIFARMEHTEGLAL